MRRAEVVALGLIQGPAELLPISSSGHVAALPVLLGWEHARPGRRRRKELEVALHAGGAVGLVVGLRRELMALPLDVALLSMIPTVALAFLAEHWIEERLGGPVSLAAGLVAGGGAVAADRRPACGWRRTRARATACCSASRRADIPYEPVPTCSCPATSRRPRATRSRSASPPRHWRTPTAR